MPFTTLPHPEKPAIAGVSKDARSLCKAGHREPLLTLSGIDVYYGLAQILFDVSFDVGGGEVVALLGRNGAGKSTTLKAIIGLAPPAKGTIAVAGQRIDGLPPNRISRLGIGYV